MSTTSPDPVAAFAAAVRHHLSDLPPDQVHHLTDGLEANLAAARDDGDGQVLGSGADARRPPGEWDLAARFGPAQQYAADLRASAGLDPAPEPQPTRSGGLSVGRRLGEAAGRTVPARARPLLVSAGETLRPLWWVGRGWAWYVLSVAAVMTVVSRNTAWQPYVPAGWGTWLLLGALVIASVAAGRSGSDRRTELRRRMAVANAAAVIAFVVAVPACIDFLGGALAVASP